MELVTAHAVGYKLKRLSWLSWAIPALYSVELLLIVRYCRAPSLLVTLFVNGRGLGGCPYDIAVMVGI